MREALQVQKPAIVNALRDYERVRTLVAGMGPSATESKRCHGLLSKLSPELLEPIVERALPGSSPLVHHHCNQPVATVAPAPFRVFARVRPLNERESAAGEYAAIDTTQQTLSCHRPLLARTGRRLSMLHRSFACDRVFGTFASEAQVCDGVLRPLLERVTGGVGDATVILYGQTGAGKTHTLSSMIARCEAVLDSGGGAGREVRVSFYEVATAGCCDLLNGRAKIHLRSDEHEVPPQPARRPPRRSPVLVRQPLLARHVEHHARPTRPRDRELGDFAPSERAVVAIHVVVQRCRRKRGATHSREQQGHEQSAGMQHVDRERRH